MYEEERDFYKSYEKIVKIGEGSFGKVYLCQAKSENLKKDDSLIPISQ